MFCAQQSTAEVGGVCPIMFVWVQGVSETTVGANYWTLHKTDCGGASRDTEKVINIVHTVSAMCTLYFLKGENTAGKRVWELLPQMWSTTFSATKSTTMSTIASNTNYTTVTTFAITNTEIIAV